MILPDTSIWIDYLRIPKSALGQLISDDAPLAHTEPVLMELLLGTRDESDALNVRNLLLATTLVRFDTAADFEGAAAIYRLARVRGIHAGKIDCLILSVAWRRRLTLMTRDHQQARIARFLELDVIEPAR